MKMATPDQIKALEGGFDSPATDEEIDKAYATLPNAKPWLDLVEAGTRKPACSWPRNYAQDGYMYPDDDLRFLRSAAKGLAVRARAENDAKQHGKAFATIAAMDRLARHMDDGPTFIDKLAAMSVERYALRALRRSLFVGADPARAEQMALKGLVPDWREGYKTDFVIGLVGLQKGILPYSGSKETKEMEKILSAFGVNEAIILAYVEPYQRAWKRFGDDPQDFRRIQAAFDRWKQEKPTTPGPLGDLERYVAEPFSGTFGNTWGRFLTDRLIVAEAARIRGGKPPKHLDPFTGKPFVRETKNGKPRLWSPGPTGEAKDDLTVALP